MPTLLITGNTLGCGKTSLAAGLLAHLADAGRPSAYYKPFSADADDGDARFVSSVLAEAWGVVAGPAPATVPADAAGIGQAASAVEALREQAGVVVVELTDSLDPAQFAETLGASVLLVLGYPLGVENDSPAGIAALGDRLAGVVVNAVPPYRRDEAARQAASAGIAAPVVVPESRVMLAATVAQVASQLSAEWVLEPVNADALIERYLIGGNIMDSGPTYFGRYANQAVIARAQRPDIQMASMGRETRCLVLTGPGDATEYVKAEARERDIPLLRVASSTEDTAAALGGIVGQGTAHSLAKARHYAGLLRKHASPGVVESWLADAG